MASSSIIYRLIAHDSASRTFHQIGRAASGTDSVMGKLGRTAKLAGEAVAIGLAGGLAEGAKKAAEFQSEMTRISTQAGATAKDVKVLSDQVLKLGTTTQQGPQHLAESLYHLKSVGMDNVSAMKALKEASDLAAVGHANLEETTNALAGAWRTGIKGATSFHEAVSTVNAIIGAGNMSMDQFNAAIGTGILPSAKEFGLSMKQVGAALALMTDEGIDSASAATRLRMSFSLLGAPSKAAEKQLKRIHLTGLDLAKAMRGKDGIIGAIQMLKDHLDASGLSAAEESQLLSRAFGGGRSSSGILLMINNLDVLKKKQDQINHSTGKFDEAVKMQRKTAEAQWHLLVSNLEVMGIRVGTVVLPPVTSFIHFLASTAMPAAARFGHVMASIIPVAQIKGAIAEVKSTVGGFLSGLTGGSGFGGLLKGLTGSSGKAAKNPIDKFPTTVLGVGTGAPHLGSGQTSSTKGPGKALALLPHYGVGQVAPVTGVRGPALAPMPHGGSGLAAPLVSPKAKPPKSAAEKLGETIRKSISDGFAHINWGKLGSILGKGLGDAIGWVGKHTADFTKKIAGVLGKLDFVKIGKSFGKTALPLAIGFITSVFDPLFSLDFWKKHWLDTIVAVISIIPIGKVAGALGKIFEHIPFLKILEPLLSKISKLGKLIEKGFGKIFGPIRRGVVDGFKKVFPKAEGFVKDLVERFVFAPARKLKTFAKLIPHAVGTGIEKGTSWVTEKALELGKKIVRPFAKAGSWLWTKGSELVRGLMRGAINRAKGIGSWAWRNIAKPVVDTFAKAGSWLWTKGKALVGGLKTGAIDGAKSLGVWTYNTVARPIVTTFTRAGSWLWTKGKAFVGGLKTGAANGARGLGSWVWRNVGRPAVNTFSKAGSWLWSKGKALIAGLKTGVVDGIKGIGSWIKRWVIDPVVGAVKHFFGIRSPSRVFMSIGGHLVSGLMKGMARTSGSAIAHKVFGSMPKALASIVKKGLVSISSLPGKALKALGALGGDVLGLLGFSSGGGGGVTANMKIGQALAGAHGWTGTQWNALKQLWIGESGWNERALNKSSGAYGIPQSLPASKMASAGSDWQTNPATQIKWGLSYIASRYGSPLNAYSQWLARSPHWYAKGTGGAARGLAWVGERGPELVNFKGGEDVLSHPDSMSFAKAHGIKLPGYASGTILNAADRVRRDRKRVADAKDEVARAKRRHKGLAAAEAKLRAAQKELKAAEIALSNAKRSSKTSIATTIANGLAKTLSTGTSSAIASALKSLNTKLLNAGFDKLSKAVMKSGSKLEKLADKRAAIEKKIAEAKQYAADQSSNIKDFLSISGTSATDVGSLISQMTGQQKTASNFVGEASSLKARGASKELLQQLSDAGPGSQLATILGQKSVTTMDIGKLNKLVASGGKLADNFGKSMADMMYDTGKHAGEGFLAGLKATEKDLQKQIDKLAKDLVKAIKHALKIKSPSQVMRDEVGRNVVLGMAHGIDLHSHLVGASAQRLADTATGVSLRRRYVPTASSGRHSGGREEAWERLAAALEASGSEVHVHFNDDRLRDLIDVQVKPKLKASEDRQAYRAKVGRRSG